MRKFSDAHGRCGSAKRVFNHNFGLRLAENQSDAWLVAWVLKHVVDCRQVEDHLACILRFELAALQVDDDEASKFEVIEDKVEPVVLAFNLNRILASDEGKTNT